MTSQQSDAVVKQSNIHIINRNGLSPEKNIYEYTQNNNGLSP